ncbi:MAG: hypothetical protein PVF16_06465, partial [Chromatiales bacterium]
LQQGDPDRRCDGQIAVECLETEITNPYFRAQYLTRTGTSQYCSTKSENHVREAGTDGKRRN